MKENIIKDLQEMNISRYLAGIETTDNGYCYKDVDGFKNNPDEICYISEYNCDDLDIGREEGIDHTDEVLKEQFVGYSRNTLRCTIAEFYDITPDVVKNNMMDAKVFSFIDWQCPDTYLNELDVEDLYD